MKDPPSRLLSFIGLSLLGRLWRRALRFARRADLAPLVFHLVDEVLWNGGLAVGGRLHSVSCPSASFDRKRMT
ncbi:hypothetical protein AJ87_17785 [Rhizobium yanglingense]|nr:hypothetical protein AJ87_17785 [Rhizobium yanglingense]